MRRKVLIAGIGAGNPDFVTVQAIGASGHVRLFFIPNAGMGENEPARLRAEIVERYVRNRPLRSAPYKMPGESAGTPGLEAMTGSRCGDPAPPDGGLTMEVLDASQSGAFLAWSGFPLGETVLHIFQRLRSAGGFALDHEAMPGDSDIQVLASAHKVALCNIGRSILTATGRSIAGNFPNNADSVVLMLDADTDLPAPGEPIGIHWTLYAGMPDDVLVSGKLAEIVDDIARVRHDALRGKRWDVSGLRDKRVARYQP